MALPLIAIGFRNDITCYAFFLKSNVKMEEVVFLYKQML